jgi:hypothetical protein
MTVREEYELVAKAAGYEYEWFEDLLVVGPHILIRETGWRGWNPKTDDGDSRRLQVDLEIDVMVTDNCAHAFYINTENVSGDYRAYFTYYPDKYAAVKAAVWDVAVEVAKRRMEK